MSTPVRASLWSIDANDVITSVGGDWDEFASANDAASLCGEHVIGKPLFEFIAGEETRRIYRLLIRKARATSAPILVPFRCDSPEMRRHMRLEITPARGDGIDFRGVFVAAEFRPHVGLLDARQPRSPAQLVSCSFCMRLRAAGDAWIDAEEVVAQLGLLSGAPPPRLVHGVCPECSAKLRERLGAESGGPGT